MQGPSNYALNIQEKLNGLLKLDIGLYSKVDKHVSIEWLHIEHTTSNQSGRVNA